ncbi:DUF262 domain-containing protein [Salinibacterium sp. SYSU T00001]|uniref:DUF262 domain-containing protein n=1 Tax=Homoserinimonas sedimenticola TaxID=2986805 RepID=UPI00223610FB|nr:DUF262 domain-containing protein [Salinibacterium sedimenticola]MCW4384201.1 DUF262 domain-containing protein [Salinibacterium sedimenticola]
MDNATNVDATAVNTIRWLSSPGTSIVVPVYQRQYRWDIGGCEQLLADIRAVADAESGHMHFIGSILSSESAATEHTGSADATELVLIDGQQRITTLMLLIAALHHTVLQDLEPSGNAELAAELERVLVRGDGTTLRPHRAWAGVFEDVVLGRRSGDAASRDSRFDDNYAFFRSQIASDEVGRIWRGLTRLEHVAITLRAHANAQQIFESLNSTGEPLRDHELIHNYVLMGLSHAEQYEIEDGFWLPIERNTGDTIGTFWRHYLIMRTGLEVEIAGERGVYDAFRHEFPLLDHSNLGEHAAEWREFSEIYRRLLDPAQEPDAEIGRQLAYVGTFGRSMFPLVMRAYRDHSRGALTRDSLIATLERVQSLLLRRTVVGVSTDRLVARLCRAWAEGPDAFEHAIARITPSDARVRVALKYSPLPHPSYVLGRIAGVESTAGLDVEHLVPLAPADDWSGDGVRTWADYSEDEQNSHRALAPTLGNLTLLEEHLAERAVDASFDLKRQSFYRRSKVDITRELGEVTSWNTAAIGERGERMVAEFLRIWRAPMSAAIDDDGLTPILDAVLRRGWPRGWQREFEYVEYAGEHWEVYDVKHLFNRIFKRLWADARGSVVAYSSRRGGPVFEVQAWNGHWDSLDEDHFLYMGWDSKYMLTALQGVLEEADLASEVFVKYSYIGQAM